MKLFRDSIKTAVGPVTYSLEAGGRGQACVADVRVTGPLRAPNLSRIDSGGGGGRFTTQTV